MAFNQSPLAWGIVFRGGKMSVSVDDLPGALAQLGASRHLLSDVERDHLDQDGFVVLAGLLDGDQVDALRQRYDDLVALEGEGAGAEFHQETGTHRLANLVNKGAIFDALWTNPKQLAAIDHVLNGREIKLSSLNGRTALPGAGHQGLHTDWARAVTAGEYEACNSMWMLDDFTAENGATRVIPGSHRWATLPAEALADPAEAHPDQILVTGQAGSVVVFNAHLWHSGRNNGTDRPRHAIHAFFVRRDAKPQTVQRDYLLPETAARLPSGAIYLLDAA
jgi:ectoine hydroxylase-related dioxygenase (phytanoyl-CoA dioxygenase family)